MGYAWKIGKRRTKVWFDFILLSFIILTFVCPKLVFILALKLVEANATYPRDGLNRVTTIILIILLLIDIIINVKYFSLK